MTDIKTAFENGKALIPFVTAGDPDLETTESLLIEMSKNGADIIEIGIPFSDPIAEGVAIQEADLRALAAGVTTDKIFDMVKRVSGKISCALAVMTYMNPIFVYGTEKFMAKCAEYGISAVIVPDTPYEEKDELAPACEKYGVDLISMIAPTSAERVTMIAGDSSGFLFCIPSTGVTGVAGESIMDIGEMVELVRSVSGTPCAVGYGNPTEEQARLAAKCADGVIIGDEVVRIIAENRESCVASAAEYISKMKKAIS